MGKRLTTNQERKMRREIDNLMEERGLTFHDDAETLKEVFDELSRDHVIEGLRMRFRVLKDEGHINP